jgi:hypothetical protein
MEWTDRFHPQVWVVESNAFQLYLVHEKQLNDYVRGRGCEIRGHYTSRINKHDEDFGVAAMAPLFGNIRVSENENRVKHHDGNNLIELPLQTPMVKMLVEQLISWAPKTRNKTDAVMALWFCETVARDWVLRQDDSFSWYGSNPYASPRDVNRRQVVDVRDYADSLIVNGGRVGY